MSVHFSTPSGARPFGAARPLWELASPLDEHSQNGVIAFSPDGKRLARSHDSRTYQPRPAEVLDAEAGRRICSVHGHTWPVTEFGFSPDGRRVVSCDGNLRLWDAESGRPLLEFRPEGGAWFRLLGFPHDGRRLLAVTTGQSAALVEWDGTPRPAAVGPRSAGSPEDDDGNHS